MTAAEALAVADLTVDRDGRRVLNSIDLSVHESEILAVLGHNGAGKTTLLWTIMGLLRAKQGTVCVGGKYLTNTSTQRIVRHGLSMTMQGGGVFPGLTVAENLSMPAKREQMLDVDDIFDLFPVLRERSAQDAASLSGGQRQMLSIAMALRTKPRVLLLDEPSVGLQPNLVEALLTQVSDIRTSLGTAVVLVEQNISTTLRTADQVAVLNQGQVALRAAARDVSESAIWELL